MPTTSPPAPTAKSVSVMAGASDTMRGVPESAAGAGARDWQATASADSRNGRPCARRSQSISGSAAAGLGVLARARVALVHDAQAVQRQIGVDLADLLGVRSDERGQASRRDHLAGEAEIFFEPLDHAVDHGR